ncbi:MAG: ATP synthase F1 subunit epsilon [Candidatus Kapabacteria bacterium]|nr:ATP synthase F1 subunit epsilon [Candidatus Kapabacteria bacterium]
MADRTLNVSIVTPKETAFEGKALAVSVPGAHSPFQVLYNHAPIISSLESGVIRIEDENNHVVYFASREGFVEVLKNNVNIIVQELVPASAIDADAVESEYIHQHAASNTGQDRHARESARVAATWAAARMRAARMMSEGS